MDRELSLPFRVDARGRIATVAAPHDRAKQHLTTFLLTSPGERVMRPDHGVPLQDAIFGQLDHVTAQLLLTRAQERLGKGVPDVVVRELRTSADSAQAALRLTVEFALVVGAGEGDTRSTTIQLGGEGQ